MIRALSGRLHRDRSASIMPLILVILLVFAYLTLMILNTGQVVTEKTRTQNGVDAAAMVQADWTARYLNVMAMNNTAIVQSFVAMVTSFTVLQTTADLLARSGVAAYNINSKRQEICPQRAAAAAAIVVAAGLFTPPAYAAGAKAYDVVEKVCNGYYFFAIARALSYSAWVVSYWVKYRPLHGFTVAREGVASLNAFNQFLVESLPARVGATVTDSLLPNDVTSVFFYPPCKPGTGCEASRERVEGSPLPVDPPDGTTFLEMCQLAEIGSDGQHRLNFSKLGFPNDKGPLTAGGSPRDNPHLADYISKEPSVRTAYFPEAGGSFGFLDNIPLLEVFSLGSALESYKNWFPEDDKLAGFTNVFALFTGGDDWLGLMGELFDDALKYVFPLGTKQPFPLIEEDQDLDNNKFRDNLRNNFVIVCTAGTLAATLKLGELLGDLTDFDLSSVLPDIYRLKGQSLVSQFGTGLVADAGVVFDEEKDLAILAFAARSSRGRVIPWVFRSASDTDYAYAQALVFNPQAYDLFTQDWQATLMPARRLDKDTEGEKVLEAMRTRATTAFDALVQLLNRAGGFAPFKGVNAH